MRSITRPCVQVAGARLPPGAFLPWSRRPRDSSSLRAEGRVARTVARLETGHRRPLPAVAFFALALFGAIHAGADPHWLRPHLLASDCEALHWRDQPLCHQYVRAQSYERAESYFQALLPHSESEYCDPRQVLEGFDESQVAWTRWPELECAWRSHCLNLGCGQSGDGKAVTGYSRNW